MSDTSGKQKSKFKSLFAEQQPIVVESEERDLKLKSRRDFILYGVGGLATAAGVWWLLPDDTKSRVWHHGIDAEHNKIDPLDRLVSRVGLTSDNREKALGKVLTFDDDLASVFYSPSRKVPTYAKEASVQNLRNNYDGATPDVSILNGWQLKLSGLASGRTEKLTLQQLLTRFAHREQVTRLICVEGWSAIAWWGGFQFADLIKAFPPDPKAKWISLISDVNLDADGNSDQYYVSIDLDTAIHPQALLTTHHNGKPISIEHGAPLRLIVPMKLGLKNIKAITQIIYTAQEPKDYWNERGYSKYDGV